MEGIALEKVCKSFGTKQVLRDFSAFFPYGRVTCIMGSSGRGKTTLLRILMGLEQPDSGELKGLSGLRQSAVFQEDRLCEQLSVSGNIRLISPRLTREEVRRAASGMGLLDCENQKVSACSGGMRRRVALLRALLADYDVLLLDEPFKGLDAQTKAIVIAQTKQRSAGRTVLLVTHDLEEGKAMSADHWISLAE